MNHYNTSANQFIMQKFKGYSGIVGILPLLLIQGCSLQNTVHPSRIKQPATITASPKPGLILQSATTSPEALDANIDIPANTEINDSWQYLISLFAITDVDNARIDQEMAWFLAHPEYIEKIQTRAEPYLFNIIKEVEEKGLPGEFGLLPAIESGFKAHAYSNAQAAGLWQFIPSTGKLYGLQQNWWYDGRRDIYASTEAATSYLKKLGLMFDNDWLLALASYNAGMGTVGRAVKRNASKNQATDFWSLDLPRETENYVPRLLALAKIFANAEQYDINLKTQSHQPAFVAVDIGSQLDLAKAAELSEVSLEELFHLNPGFNRTYTPPQGPHRLLIPVDNAELFKKNLASLPADERVQWRRHQIQSGESLSTIAQQYKMQVPVIRKVNHLVNNNIRAGAYLLIPSSRSTVGNNPFSQASHINTENKDSAYTVKSGDNLWTIARRLKVNSKDIARWNHISLKTLLRPGQKLTIKQRNKAVQQTTQHTGARQPIHYTVRSGDSLSTISEKFNVRVADLRKWNESKLGKYLKPGQKLEIKASASQPST